MYYKVKQLLTSVDNCFVTIAAMKNDCTLFSRLYIAYQTREGDLENFFRHENQPWPPSLFKLGEIRTGSEADLIGHLVSLVKPTNDDTIALPPSPMQDRDDIPQELLEDCDIESMLDDPDLHLSSEFFLP